MARARGFTLIELAMAVVLLAIGLLALTAALARSLHATAHARAVHAALREAAATADSLVAAPSFTAAAQTRNGVDVWWEPAACAGRACVRVSVAPSGDTLSLLVARAEAE